MKFTQASYSALVLLNFLGLTFRASQVMGCNNIEFFYCASNIYKLY